MKVRFTRRATAQLDAIFNYIAKDNPAAAAAVVARVEDRAADLSYFPIPANLPGKRASGW